MQETLEQVLIYIRAIWRYRWAAMATAWLVMIAGMFGVSQMPDVYEANTRVYVNTESILRPLLRGLAADSIDINERLGLMTKELLSRPNLKKVIRIVDLDHQINSAQDEENVLSDLEKSINISAVRTHRATRAAPPNLYIITVRKNDPQLAKDIVQALLNTLIEETLGDSRKDTHIAQEFLNKQIMEYEAKLVAAENRLREFKTKNIGTLPGQGSTFFSRLQSTQAALETVQLEFLETKFKRDELERQLKDTTPKTRRLSGTSGAPVMSATETRLLSMQSRLDELKLKYTANHPDVAEAERAIAILKDRITSERSFVNTQGEDSVYQTSAVYQELQVALSASEADLASLKVRKSEFERRVKRLEGQIETLPEVEAMLQKLNRDYQIDKENYSSLVGRRESALISEDVEETGSDLTFKVIDPPRVPISPIGPKRFLLNTAMLFGGIVAGLGFAFFLSQINPAIYARKSLQNITDIPLFGRVTRVWTKPILMKRRLEVSGFFLVCILLMSVYGSIVYIQLADSGAASSVVVP